MKVNINCSGKDIPNPPDSILSINANQLDSMDVFFTVEEIPDFPGGDDARIQFLAENIKYPREARERGIQGTVYITFIITITGEIKDVKSLKSPHQLLTNEAIRVIKLMPKWTPGKQNGKVVNVQQYNMPIKFELSGVY